jgi:hypothetical protein
MDNIVFALRDSIGEEKLRHFVQVLNRQCKTKGRLYYWQEQALQKIAETNPQYAHLTFDEVLDKFAICHVHGVSLIPGEIAIESQPLYTSNAYYEKEESDWPYAHLVMYNTSVQETRHDDHKVLFCPQCRVALIDWNRGRTRKYGLPQGFKFPPLQ